MHILPAFLGSAAVAVGFALLVAILLRRPLGRLLEELCGNERRARFWSVFWSIAIVLTTLLGMLVTFPLDDVRWADHPELALVALGLRTSLMFLLMALALLGAVLLAGIGRFERDQRAQRRAGAPPPSPAVTPPA